MPRKYSDSGFIWDEGQCFFGVEGNIVTSYSNEHLTMSFVQDKEGNLIGITYETDDKSGDIDFGEDVEKLSQLAKKK